MTSYLERRGREKGIGTVILDAQSIPSVDISAARMLNEVADELKTTDERFVVVHEDGQVRDVLRAVLAQDGQEETAYPTVRDAVAAMTAVGTPARSARSN